MTPLWIVDAEAGTYLRAGSPDSAWVARMRSNPAVRLERSGSLQDVRLVEESTRLDSVHAMMAEKYGWADDFVALMSGDRSLSIAYRLERLETAPSASE